MVLGPKRRRTSSFSRREDEIFIMTWWSNLTQGREVLVGEYTCLLGTVAVMMQRKVSLNMTQEVLGLDKGRNSF